MTKEEALILATMRARPTHVMRLARWLGLEVDGLDTDEVKDAVFDLSTSLYWSDEDRRKNR